MGYQVEYFLSSITKAKCLIDNFILCGINFRKLLVSLKKSLSLSPAIMDLFPYDIFRPRFPEERSQPFLYLHNS